MRRRGRLLCGLLVLVVVDQLIQYTVLRDGRIFGRRIAPFDPPLFSAAQEASLDRLRGFASGAPETGAIRWDAELGWTTPVLRAAGDSWFDELGARRPLAEEDTRQDRPVEVLLCGCSFTYGDEVKPEETWGYALEREMGVRVANCGVSAYGIDQALMRMTRVADIAKPREIWLGVLQKALPRVVSMYRPAMRHHEPSVSFKPRFTADADGAIADFYPNPAPTPADAVRLLETPGAFFAAVGARDAFVAAFPAAYSPRGTSAWHYSAGGRVVLTHLENRPRSTIDAGLEDPHCELSRLVDAITLAFAQEAELRGARFRLVILPDADDLVAAARGHAPLAKFVAAWRDAGVDVISLERALLAAGATSDAEWFRPGGHYAPRAHAVVAAGLLRAR